MIPPYFLRKMGVYDLNLDGITIQAKVVDNEELANDGVAELRSRLDESFPIVGFDLKCTIKKRNYTDYIYPFLVLYVKDRCLLLQLGRMNKFPDSVSSLLRDKKICLLGLQVSQKLEKIKLQGSWVGCFPEPVLKTGVDIGTFAARALHNRELEGCVNLVDLASKAGLPTQDQKGSDTKGSQSQQVSNNNSELEGCVNLVDLASKAGLPTHDQKGSETKGSQSQQVSNNNPDWGALCFTQEEVKFALENAYFCYSIGTKLMSAL